MQRVRAEFLFYGVMWLMDILHINTSRYASKWKVDKTVMCSRTRCFMFHMVCVIRKIGEKNNNKKQLINTLLIYHYYYYHVHGSKRSLKSIFYVFYSLYLAEKLAPGYHLLVMSQRALTGLQGY